MFAVAAKAFSLPAVDGFLLFLARISATVAGAQEANRVYRRLSSLSDGDLAARGLRREDIGQAAFQAMTRVTAQVAPR